MPNYRFQPTVLPPPALRQSCGLTLALGRMKHATAETLRSLAGLLAAVRNFGALQERTPGAFYRKGKAFLHFHEDSAGIFADIRLVGSSFTRVPVSTSEQQAGLLALVGEAVDTKIQSPC